jgi:hypothetical protein
MTITVNYKPNVSAPVKLIINSIVADINGDPQFTRNVTIVITSDPSVLPTTLQNYLSSLANYTFSNGGVNNELFVNENFDYSGFDLTQQQSLMHELTHVEYPGSAAGTGLLSGHTESFYEDLAKVSISTGIPMSGDDYSAWVNASNSNSQAIANYVSQIQQVYQNGGGSASYDIKNVIDDYKRFNSQCFIKGTSNSMLRHIGAPDRGLADRELRFQLRTYIYRRLASDSKREN